jgi:hypothetical protein
MCLMVALLGEGVRLGWNRTMKPSPNSIDRLYLTAVRTSVACPVQSTSSGSSLRDSFDGVNDMPTGNAKTPLRSRKRWGLKLPTKYPRWVGSIRRLWATADVNPFADPVEQQELSDPFVSDEDSCPRAASIPPRPTDCSGAAENRTRSRINVKIRSFTRRNAIVPPEDSELVPLAPSTPRLEGESKPDDFNAQLDTLHI